MNFEKMENKSTGFDELILELHENIARCDRDCHSCHKYILQLSKHLNSTHVEQNIDPCASTSTAVKVSPRRSTRHSRNRKSINFSDEKPDDVDSAKDQAYSVMDVLDIKCESDMDDIDFDLNTLDDPEDSIEDVGDFENTSNEKSEVYGLLYRNFNENLKAHDLVAQVSKTPASRSANSEKHGTVKPQQNSYHCKQEQCGQSFTAIKKLERHVKTFHPEEKCHTCVTCGEGFTQKKGLDRHIRIYHTEENEHTCKPCDVSFDHLVDLRRHRLTHAHRVCVEPKSRQFCCETCGQKCPTQFYLTEHERSHTGERPFMCHICTKSFVAKANLKIHLKRHNEEKKYVCSVCDKGFVRKGQLTLHMRFHTGEKPYKCDQCDKCYSRRDNLTLHKRSHTGEKPFMCEHCSKCFQKKVSLKDHMATHEPGKAFFCEHCGQGFKKRTQLSSHYLIHTGETPHVCKVCGKRYKLDHTLKLHLRTHTNEEK